MRILFDARTIRTSAGRYVFRGLTSNWRDDPRVEEVVAAISADFDRDLIPEGVRPVVFRSQGWLAYVMRELPAIADRAHADVIFSPNASPPPDPRSVLYFQDLYHFRLFGSSEVPIRDRVGNVQRALWRAVAAPGCMMAVPVSGDIASRVRRRSRIPVVMIPNGVDVGAVRWTGEQDRVFVMGGTGSRKGEDVAIRAWAALVRESGSQGTTLQIGGVEPAARREELRRLAANLGIESAVTIDGALPRAEFLERIRTSRVAVSCSSVEAFGLPVAEALAIGAPVLCAAIPAHAELVTRAGAGRVFPPNAAGDLAQRLRAGLSGDPPRRLLQPPPGWSWRDRAGEHVDAYERYRPNPARASATAHHARTSPLTKGTSAPCRNEE